jgi:hypothetical protein
MERAGAPRAGADAEFMESRRMDAGRMRQVAVVLAWVAAGLLAGALLVLQAERMAAGDRALWTQPSGS